MSAEAAVWEIYSAIQGEGLWLGERHVFLRVAGCNLDCRFCDTSAREARVEACRVERTAGRGDFVVRPNPLGWREASDAVRRLSKGPPRALSVSFTGGEPLLQPDFVRAVARVLQREGIGTYLETNGTLPDALAAVCDRFDRIAMDLKLPSSAGGRALWDVHRECLRIASRGEVFAKAVVTPETSEDDVREAARLVAGVSSDIALVLQPATPAREVRERVPRELMRLLESGARKVLDNVRVIPQVHPVLGER